MTVKVLIVDDSELIREILTQVLSADSDIEVVGTAVDPYDAREKIKQLEPDVITLDIEMPRMDGITFLKNLMRLRPMPVVMISTLTEKGAQATLDALQIGAIDFVPKPRSNVQSELSALAGDITGKVKVAASVNVEKLGERRQSLASLHPPRNQVEGELSSRFDVIVIGSSTGGTQAIKEILSELPANMPPIVIVQHMPGGFTRSFADRLNRQVALNVKEFNEEYELIKPGQVYIAAGDKHALLQRSGSRYRLASSDTEPVNRHKPAVDVTMESLARRSGDRAIGIILTGMGSDGAKGLKAMQLEGATTIAQDEDSSVVWGMPGSAVRLGAANEVIPLDKIAERLVSLCY